jgi:hypothetical protein
MGVAIVVIAVVSTLIHSGNVNNWFRAVGGAMILGIVAVLGWTSTGIGVHYVLTSTAEAQTIRQLDRWLSASPYEVSGVTIVVVAGASSICNKAALRTLQRLRYRRGRMHRQQKHDRIARSS